MAKARKASDVVAIEGLPESNAIWGMTIVHPAFNADDIEASIKAGGAYAETNTNHKRGEHKKVTQYASDSENKNILDDGLTAERDKVVTLKYDGSTIRWMDSELSDPQKIFVQELRGFESECKADDLVDKLEKLITVTMNAQNVRVALQDLDTLRNDSLSRIDTAFKFTANKIKGVKPEGEEKPKKIRKYGV